MQRQLPLLAHTTLGALLLGAAASAQTPSVTYGPQLDFELAEAGPRDFAVADLDGDGHLDVVASCGGSDSNFGTVSLAFGDGNGGFGDDGTISGLPHPRAVTAADLNGDGLMDIVAADSGHDVRRVDVLLGTGGGNFALGSSLVAGKFPVAVLARDLDGDGVLDLAVAANVLNAITIFLGNGDGSFGPPSSYLAATHGTGLACGDLDGDGDLDLALSHYDGVKVMLNTGNGSFVGGATVGSLGTTTESVDIGDLNGDGKLDIASTLIYANQIHVDYGNGAGGFGYGGTLPTGGFPEAVRIRDANFDGVADLLCASASAGRVELHLGTGGGGYLPVKNVAIGGSLQALELADMNEDGLPDLLGLTSVTGENGKVAVHLQLLPSPEVYCAPKTTSNGCVPAITSSGAPSVSSSQPFTIEAGAVLNQRFGLLFYGDSPAATPFSGGTLCVGSPQIRTSVQSSGGSPTSVADCSGVLTYDMNARIQSGVDPALQAGARFYAQYWFRDPQSPSGPVGLSDALQFVIGL